jgi:hypothetical protein
VALAAQNTTAAAIDTQRASRALADTASQLKTLVGRFKLSENPLRLKRHEALRIVNVLAWRHSEVSRS